MPCHRFTEPERRRTDRVRSRLTDRRKVVAWLAWSLCLACVGLALCAPLLSFLNGVTLGVFFGKRDGAIRDETDLDVLSGEFVAVIKGTMQPTSVALWLRP